MDEIGVGFADFAVAHQDLEKSRVQLDGVVLKKTDTSSDSKTMDAFVKKAKKVSKIISRYQELLQDNSLYLMSVSEKFQDVDRTLAAGYAQAIYDAQGVCPVKGSPHYKAYRSGGSVSGSGGGSW